MGRDAVDLQRQVAMGEDVLDAGEPGADPGGDPDPLVEPSVDALGPCGLGVDLPAGELPEAAEERVGWPAGHQDPPSAVSDQPCHRKDGRGALARALVRVVVDSTGCQGAAVLAHGTFAATGLPRGADQGAELHHGLVVG